MTYHFVHSPLTTPLLDKVGIPGAVCSPWTPCPPLDHLLRCFTTCWLPLVTPLPDSTAHGQQHIFYRRTDPVQASQRGPKHWDQKKHLCCQGSVWVETSDSWCSDFSSYWGICSVVCHGHIWGRMCYKDWKQRWPLAPFCTSRCLWLLCSESGSYMGLFCHWLTGCLNHSVKSTESTSGQRTGNNHL